MGSVLKTTVFNAGTTQAVALSANLGRKSLLIQNKHATQTLRVKLGGAIVTSDIDQVQTLSFSAAPASGNLILRWNGNNTAAIVSTDAASDVQTKLRAVTGLSGVTVTGSFAAGFVITLTSVTPQNFASDPQITIFSSTLDTTPSIAITTPGQYADGYVVAAANGVLSFEGDSCPGDAVSILASGASTRVEIIEGR